MQRYGREVMVLVLVRYWTILYCRVPDWRALQKTAIPPGRDETQSVNPLVRTQVDLHRYSHAFTQISIVSSNFSDIFGFFLPPPDVFKWDSPKVG